MMKQLQRKLVQADKHVQLGCLGWNNPHMKGNNLFVVIWVVGGLVSSFAWKHQPDLNEKNGLPGTKHLAPQNSIPVTSFHIFQAPMRCNNGRSSWPNCGPCLMRLYLSSGFCGFEDKPSGVTHHKFFLWHWRSINTTLTTETGRRDNRVDCDRFCDCLEWWFSDAPNSYLNVRFFWFPKALYNAPPFGALRDDGWAAVTMGRFSRWGNPL